MKTKSEQIKEAIKIDDWKKAFKIANGFFTGLAKDEKRSIDISHECNCGKLDFYRSIGVDTDFEILNAKNILKLKFG
jgi:hypothetical protein